MPGCDAMNMDTPVRDSGRVPKAAHADTQSVSPAHSSQATGAAACPHAVGAGETPPWVDVTGREASLLELREMTGL